MNSSQTIITMGALSLLTFAVFNMNRLLGESDISLAQNRYKLEALSLMTSYMEQAALHYFDESTTDTSSSKLVDDFSATGTLGFDANDGGIIDDFDDYHGLVIADTGRSGVIYNVAFTVEYVRLQGGVFVSSTSRRYHKRMNIKIYDAYDPPLIYLYKNSVKVRDTLRLSFVHSYWFYN